MATADRGKKQKKGKGKKGLTREGAKNVFDTHGNEFLLDQTDSAMRGQDTTDLDEDEAKSPALAAAMEQEEEKEEDQDEGKKDEHALKREAAIRALEARQWVCLYMQQMQTKGEEMRMMAELSPEMQATQVLEYLGEMMSDEQLAALASYDHKDITRRFIVKGQAIKESFRVKPRTLHLGAFGPVLWQVVFQSMQTQGVQEQINAAKESGTEIGSKAVAKRLNYTINFLRQLHTGTPMI